MIHYHTRPLMENYIHTDFKVVELGDQIINYNEQEKDIRSLDFYSNIDITSIDIRKDADRALKLDLSKAIPKKDMDKLAGTFDALTDFGTIEHVKKSLYHALKNSFNLVKEGGIFIHCNPKWDNFPCHTGCHKFSQEFWKEYAKAANMEVIQTGEHAAYHNTKTGWEVYAIIRKTEGAKFPTKKVFDSIYKEWIRQE